MLHDTRILFGRTMKHITRSFDTIITTAIMPIAFMLLFVYVFGGAIKQTMADNTTYINYLVPGILIMSVAMATSYAGFRIYEDKQKGMFARIKSMPIKASSFLWAHVITTVIATLMTLIVVVIVALLMGFRPHADFMDWLAIIGLLVLTSLALTWLNIMPGLSAQSMTGATALSYPLTFLPMLSSAFVPTSTMPAPVRWFAENQPLTATIDSLRSILAGNGTGGHLGTALIWMSSITIICFILSSWIYRKAI